MRKRILTLEDLVKFCSDQQLTTFSSKESGYRLSVQVPATFEVEEESDRRGLMKVKIRVFHTLKNRNGSYVSVESAKDAMPTIKNRPILAAIHQLDDGEWDFETHNVEIVESEDGETDFEYIEKQIGSFSEEEPFFEYDEEQDKTYVVAYGYIPEEYTKAADILRKKNGTKNSVELSIDELAYNAKEKYLDLKKFYVMGSTFLGKKADGEEIGEGMLGSRADIVDFSEQNNSCCNNIDESKLIETLEKLNTTLSNFNIKENSKEGGTQVGKFEELLEKYGKTVDEIEFEYEGISNEELEAKFAEAFEDDTPGSSSEEPKNEKFQKTFEISHEDIRCALYNLLAPFEEADNTYYYISGVYDDHFAYENWAGTQIYGQKYVKDGDNVAFDGERYTLHKELLTDSEYAELQSMRSNYSAIEDKLASYEAAELKTQKEAVFAKEAYEKYLETEEFTSLKEKMDEYSVEELTEKAELAFAKCVQKLGFSIEEPKEKEKKKPARIGLPFNAPKKRNGRYGNIFSK